MKILLLTCNTGEGHNQTSKALIKEFEESGHKCVAVDSLEFLSAKHSRFLCGWHERLYKFLPKTASVGYSIIDKYPSCLEKKGRWLYNYFAKGAEKLNKTVSDGKYDLVISVHPFSTVILASMQEKFPETKIKTAFIPTDYTCSPGGASGDVDVYFIPHPDLRDDFIKRGVKKEKIFPVYGIPVGRNFYSPPSKKESKEKLGLGENSKAVLLTCGSMGCGPIYKLTKKLSKALPLDTHLFVICGKNRSLYKKLCKKTFSENISILGYTNNMIDYVSASDVYITKPGGISSTEAAVLGVQTLLINAVGGCETYNFNFFVKKGSARTAKKLDGFVELTLKTLCGDKEFERACLKIKEEFSESSAKAIVKYYSKQ